MRRRYGRMATALAAGACAVALGSCSSTTSGSELPGSPSSPPSSPHPAVLPQIQPPTTKHCVGLKIGGTCSEYSELEPRPSFQDVLTINQSTAKTNKRIAALYVCSAFPESRTDPYLEKGSFRVIANGFVCMMRSKDNSMSVTASFGEGSLQQFADTDAQMSDPASRGHLGKVQGRDALISTPSYNTYTAHQHIVLSIPGSPKQVFVAELIFFPSPGSSGSGKVDSKLAARTFDFVTGELIRMSE